MKAYHLALVALTLLSACSIDKLHPLKPHTTLKDAGVDDSDVGDLANQAPWNANYAAVNTPACQSQNKQLQTALKLYKLADLLDALNAASNGARFTAPAGKDAEGNPAGYVGTGYAEAKYSVDLNGSELTATAVKGYNSDSKYWIVGSFSVAIHGVQNTTANRSLNDGLCLYDPAMPDETNTL